MEVPIEGSPTERESKKSSERASIAQGRPVHVEIRPRDTYQHHVTVEEAGQTINWSFFTRRKNLAFGLFFLHNRVPLGSGEGSGGSGASAKGQPQSIRSSQPTLKTVRETIMASRKRVIIDPPASPKPGHGSASIPSSRANSVHPASYRLDDSLLASLGYNEAQQQAYNGSFNESLTRSRTLDGAQTGRLELLSRQQQSNASLPDLRAYEPSEAYDLPQVPLSISAPNSMEYLEILPVERYESFEQTIVGHYTAPVEGTYVLYFDNSYSVNTSKELFLTVTVGEGLPPNHELIAGWLLKKKQRRLPGWARRWCQLDRNGNLAYFEDRFSPCRGSVDLHHCTITRVPHRRQITVDSGRETFHLRAFTSEDYQRWVTQVSLFLTEEAMDGMSLTAGGTAPEMIRAHTDKNATILDYTEKLTEQLKRGEKKLNDLRELAADEDDGNIKFLIPLEGAYQSLSELYDTLADYAIFLQRSGRRMSLMSSGYGANRMRSPLDAPAPSMDEFFDAEEIVLSEENFSDEEMGEELLYSSREVTSVAPSEFATEYSELATSAELEQIPPLPSAPTGQFRARMPKLAPLCNLSISSLLRKSIGKDWSAIPMPVALNEPLSALQRLCEELEYSELLDEASRCTSSLDRMVKVVAFAVSAYAATVHRVERKPFTPILGETFEYERLDRGYRFIAEKVCHRPLIIACHAQSEQKWSFWQDQRVKNKFWGKSMEYMPTGNAHVEFADTGDHFVWNKVVTCVRNLLMGTKFAENYGEMVMTNLRTSDTATIVFKPNSGGGFFGGGKGASTNEVVATIRSGDAEKAPLIIRGRWDSMLIHETLTGSPSLIWKAAPVPNDHLEYFGFTEFAITLNDLPSWLVPHLPPSDSRLRPDQRLLESAQLEEAEQEKQRIEQMQRELRTEMEERGENWEPIWFYFSPPSAEDPEGAWRIRDPSMYWQCRQQRRWPSLPPLW